MSRVIKFKKRVNRSLSLRDPALDAVDGIAAYVHELCGLTHGETLDKAVKEKFLLLKRFTIFAGGQRVGNIAVKTLLDLLLQLFTLLELSCEQDSICSIIKLELSLYLCDPFAELRVLFVIF